MKRILTPATLILSSLLAIGVTTAFAAGQESGTTIKRVNARPTASLNGADLFKEYCAVCHGNGAKGDGPAADALKKRPADLTQLARKNGGEFPELHVINYIQGQDVVAAHGSRDMPIWGSVFSSMSSNADLVRVRTYALMKYIEQEQAK